MLKKKAVYEAEITGYTSEGEGVAHVDGMAVFVPHVIAGERCAIKIFKVGKTVAYGAAESILQASPHRVRPACPYFGACGGCAFWHMDYEEECRLKATRVQDAFERIGGIKLGKIDILGGETTEEYRNKAQFPVALCDGKPEAGFFRQRTHELIPTAHCRIQSAAADAARQCVVDWMRKYRVSVYNETAQTGLVRHIYVRNAMATGEVLVCIVANGETLPHVETLTETLRQAVPGLKTVVLGVHKKPGNAVLGDRFVPLYGDGTIDDVLCGLHFRLSPRSFYQVNRAQAERLYDKALALAELKPTDTALDLYCGTGTITLCMARKAGSVIGVEVVPAAVEDARENAARNGIGNARFLCADAGQAAKQFAEEHIHPNVILVDPPRKGLSADVIEAMASMSPERIVYVSCDPATLARDLHLLEASGYRTAAAEAVDMFPRCAHVETCVLLSHKNPQTSPPSL
ncbi:MAG: 23S rRNA (uracil(1939)-C(5))-methyltransferase RlmD [Oscillospiraceae bacterium]|nr:23S rRNA (uracil(1939)-C(5))-methyltransferase RlmD [Oscillospiraceae bacterium]